MMARVQVPSDTNVHPADYAFSHFATKISEAALAYTRTVYEHTTLSLREMEGARHRTALINGCLACIHSRATRDFDTYLPRSSFRLSRPMSSRGPAPDESFYKAVPKWRTSNIFSPRERLAIEFAERIGEAPRDSDEDEEFWSNLKQHFTDDQIVDLSLSIGSWMALGRTRHILGLEPADVCSL